jgi:hypothetical protein
MTTQQLVASPVVTGEDQIAALTSALASNKIGAVLRAKLATTTSLPANTYANGTAGKGATLTANANGALGSIDGVAAATGDLICVKNEATQSHAGLYTLVDGTAGTPWVMTRYVAADSGDKLAQCMVQVSNGFTNQNTYWELPQAQGSITVGTTALIFRPVGGFENMRTSYGIREDWTNQNQNGSLNWTVTQSGTLATWALSTSLTTATEWGVLNLPTGSTSTGHCCTSLFANGTQSLKISTGPYMSWEWKVYVNQAANNTDKYAFDCGLGDTITGADQANGVYFRHDETDTHWQVCTASGGTRHKTASSITVNPNQWYRLTVIKRAGTTDMEYYIDGVLVTTLSADIPTANPVGPFAGITKTLGGTSCIASIDWFELIPEFYLPRAA